MKSGVSSETQKVDTEVGASIGIQSVQTVEENLPDEKTLTRGKAASSVDSDFLNAYEGYY